MAPMLDSSSDDDVPLALKKATLLAPKPGAKPAVPKEGVAKPKVKPEPKVRPEHKPEPKVKPKPKMKPEPSTKPSSTKPPIGSQNSTSPSKIKVKKEYELPGQTRDTPDESDPLRKFYTSLLSQRPDSEIARKWCVQYGLLDEVEAAAFVEEVAAKRAASRPVSRQAQARASPVKRAPASSAPRKQPAAARQSVKKTEEEAWSDDDGSEAEILPTKQRRSAGPPSATLAPAGAKRKAPPTGGDSDEDVFLVQRPPRPPPAPKPRNASGKDVAFLDGGLDDGSDSDDDVPLMARRR